MKQIIIATLLLALPFITNATEENLPSHEKLRPPRSAEQVLGQDFIKDNFGITTPSQEFALPHGFVVNTVLVPWSVSGRMTQALSLANYEKTEEHLITKGLKPIKVDGKSVVVLSFLDYKDSGGGPYEESVVGILAYEMGENIPDFDSLSQFLKKQANYKSKIIEYVEHLTLGGPAQNFLSFQHAIWAGRVSISYPKYYGRTKVVAKTAKGGFQVHLDQPEVPYFKKNQIDSKKAGSLNIKIDFLAHLGFKNSQSRLFKSYYASYTPANSLCRIENQIMMTQTEITPQNSPITLKITGTSATAKLLNDLKPEVKKVIQGDNLKLVLYPEQVENNGCRAAKGLNYDYKDFYPKWLSELGERLFAE